MSFFKKKSAVDLSLEGIKDFIKLARQFPVSSLSVGRSGARITVYQTPSAPASEATAEQLELPTGSEYKPESYEKIKSDQVGVYVPVKGIGAGSKVEKGQVVAKIYAMKIESDITADKDCTIKEVLVKKDELIGYGQPLFFIE